MKHPDLNASGSSKLFTGFDADFGAMEANGLSGREVGKACTRCVPTDGRPLTLALPFPAAAECEQARGEDLAGACLVCCLGLKVAFRVTVAIEIGKYPQLAPPTSRFSH
ncbi:uncharacterized protein FOMMEDRAFT_19585 [Fomitiporia mediterranea MF3/22]|uniref:uncharacterized protein n=1 Tax=Fomitiporia mediterranea (strain MF3/22) TaxID=694068 RepID=UPI000440969C|nr:uncharacterized protein FOMMEDRAFT_19585 [Fomitiporia mediterranea MF3/22]EJD04333.1 hypothetical protein FOMMEDRAFT_19585 [Fomitiporia mediterranea MF3/22]